MAVDVSRIPNNNKFDPVREAILQLQTEIEDTGATIGNGTLTISTSSPLTGSGTFTANQTGPTSISIGIDGAEYLTNITHDTVNQKLVVTYGDGTTADLSLAQYIDDTNLARLVSGSLDNQTGIATFTRDDATTFTVDLSALFDDTDTNDFLTSASFDDSNGIITFGVTNQTSVTVDIDGRYPLVGDLTAVSDNIITSADFSATDNRFKLTLTQADAGTIEASFDDVVLSESMAADYIPYIKVGGGDGDTTNAILNDSFLKINGSTLELDWDTGNPLTVAEHDLKMRKDGGGSGTYYEATYAADSVSFLHYASASDIDTAKIGATTTGRVRINDTYNLPAGDGTSGQVLSTNGSGDLSWVAAGGPTTSDLQDVTDNGATTTNNIDITGGSTLRIFNSTNTTQRLTLNQASNAIPVIYNYDTSDATFKAINIGGANNTSSGLSITDGTTPDTVVFGTLHVGSSASLLDGTDPDISTGITYSTSKVVTPKLVFLNDAAGDDNYITCDDNNNAYSVNGQSMGAWYEFVGDKLAADTNNSAGIVASGLLTKQVQGVDGIFTGSLGVSTTVTNADLDVQGTALIGNGTSTRADLGLTLSTDSSNTFVANTDLTDTYRQFTIINDNDTVGAYSSMSFRVYPSTGTAMADIKLVRAGTSGDSTLYTTIKDNAGNFKDIIKATPSDVVINGDLTITGDGGTIGTSGSIADAFLKIGTGLGFDPNQMLFEGAGYINATGALYISGGATGTGNNLTLLSNGLVGIGTDSPQTKLHLTGAITISDVGGTDNVTLIQFTESNNYDQFAIKGDFAGAGGENKLKFTTDLGGGDILTLKGDGNVGIGTTTPTMGLHVAQYKGFLVGNTTNWDSTYISPQNENTINTGYGYNADDGDLWVNYRGYQDGQTRFRNFVIGDGKGSAIARFTGSNGRLEINPNKNSQRSLRVYYDMEVYNSILFTDTSYNVQSAVGGANGELYFYTNGTATRNVTILSGGQMLIGQTSNSTSQALQVNGFIDQTATTAAFRLYNGSTFVGGLGNGQWAYSSTYLNDYAMYATNNVLLSAGGTYPSFIINGSTKEIGFGDGTYNAGLYAISNNQTNSVDTNWGLQIQRTAGVDDYNVRLKFYPQSNTSRKLGLYNSRGTDWILYADGNTNGNPNVIIPSGNLGIGTTSPSQKLQVAGIGEFAGAIRITETGTAQNILIGNQDSGGTNKPSRIMGVNGALRFGWGDSWSGEGGTFTEAFQSKSNGDVYFNNSVGIGTTSPSAKLNTNLSVEGSILAYLAGTAYTFDGDANIAVTHNSSTMGTGTAAGLLLANNNNSNNAISPLIAFSARSASNSYNHTYAAIYGQKRASGADSNWNRGDLIFATANSTGPQERMRILDGGNVGIGDTSPSTKLDVAGDIRSTTGISVKSGVSNLNGGIGATMAVLNDIYAYIDLSTQNTNGSWIDFSKGDGTDYGGRIRYVNGSNRFDFFASGSSSPTLSMINGRLGINRTAPSAPLDVNGNTITRGALFVLNGMETAGNFSACQIKLDTTNTIDTTGWQGISFDTSTAANYGWSIGANRSGSGRGSFRFYEHVNSNAGTERFTLQQDGNVGIGDSTPSYKLDVNGTIRATGDVIAYSDARVKENVKTIDNALDKVTQLRGVSYNKISETEEKIGVIAQEIEKVLPQVVQEDDEGMKSVAYGNIVGVLIEAIKEQQKQIDELKARLDGSTY